MQVEAGKPLLGKAVDVVFIGSCTNGRPQRPAAAANMLRGRRVAERVRLMVVPGSHEVKRQAEAEGLDEIFRAAGGEWREPGCSMCIGMNGDTVPSGQLAVSTSNRNFEGRQGSGARTVLASPLTAAAAAVAGVVADPREFVSRVIRTPSKQFARKTVVMPNDDIDTDQIIPARFLTTTTQLGLGKNLFAEWRYAKDGSPRPEFILNRPESNGAAVLVAAATSAAARRASTRRGRCVDFGFRAVISTSIADIFMSNALKNGLLPVIVDADSHAWLLANPDAEVLLDLETATLDVVRQAQDQVSDRRVLALLPDERHRPARLPDGARRRDRRVRAGSSMSTHIVVLRRRRHRARGHGASRASACKLRREALGIDLEFEDALIGGIAFDETGTPLPDATLEACRKVRCRAARRRRRAEVGRHSGARSGPSRACSGFARRSACSRTCVRSRRCPSSRRPRR